jgi:hypothetical protein
MPGGDVPDPNPDERDLKREMSGMGGSVRSVRGVCPWVPGAVGVVNLRWRWWCAVRVRVRLQHLGGR